MQHLCYFHSLGAAGLNPVQVETTVSDLLFPAARMCTTSRDLSVLLSTNFIRTSWIFRRSAQTLGLGECLVLSPSAPGLF